MVSGYLISTSLPWVEGLLTDPGFWGVTRLVLSNGFENALVLCLNFFLVKFGIPLHLFDLGLECIFWLWET